LPPRKKQELEALSSQSTSTSSSSKQSRKFNASWLRGRKQWFVYKPEEGMYCSLCQKYDQRPYNRDIWNKQPCSRLRLQSIKRHESSAAHGQSLRMERNASKVQTLPSVVSPPLPAKGMEQAFSCLYFWRKSYRQFLKDNCSEMKFSDVILDLCTNSTTRTIFPNMSTLAKICRVIPIHTADVERTFSQLKLIKTRIRNRMQEQTLDSLLRIAIEGPPLNSFPVNEAVSLWASKKQRRLYH
jgi:hypothetical protein